jgi:hypothetical protein
MKTPFGPVLRVASGAEDPVRSSLAAARSSLAVGKLGMFYGMWFSLNLCVSDSSNKI